MTQSPLFHSRSRAVTGTVHAFAGALAALFGLFAAAGCEGEESTGAASGADVGAACHGARSDYELTTKISPSGDPLKLQCLPRDMPWDMQYQVACVVIEARHVDAGQAASCNACDGAGRAPVNPYSQSLVEQMKDENAADDLNCFCAIEQIETYPAESWKDVPCAVDTSDSPVDASGKPLNGFCYVAPKAGLGASSLLEGCPEDEKQALRFVGAGVPDPSATVYLDCVRTSYTQAPAGCTPD